MAKTPNAHVKNLEASARFKIDHALAACKKLSAARREHGLPSSKMLYTAAEHEAEMRELRREHADAIRSMAKHFMEGPSEEIKRIAKLAVAGKREMTPQGRAQL